MRFLIFVSALLFFLVHISGETIITCYSDDCNEDVRSMNSLLSKLNAVIDANEKTMKYLKDLDERLTKEIQSLKASNTVEESTKLYYQPEIEKSNKISPDLTETENSQENTFNNLNTNPLKIPNKYKSWITIQRRQDGSVDFYRNWNDYKQGFGNKDGEFFLGLDEIHNLTNESPHELMIILIDFNVNLKYAHYDDFLIGNEEEKYQLKSLGRYQGSAGDYLRQHENMYFSTKDRDNDRLPGESCAISYQGAWWFNICMTSNLNGPYQLSPFLLDSKRGQGITWGNFDEIQYPYKYSQMMIRPKKDKINY